MAATLITRMKPYNQPIILGAGFGVLAIIGLLLFGLINRAEMNARSVRQTLDVENRLFKLMLNVRRAESGKRGFLLTGEETYLSDYELAKSEIAPVIAELRTMTADNSAQQQMLSQTEIAVRQKVEELDETIRLFKANDIAGAFAMIRTGSDRGYMDRVRELVDRMMAEEDQLETVRQAAATTTNRMLLIAALTGVLAIVLLAILSVLIVRRSNRDRERAQQKLRSAYDNLEEMVAQRTADLKEANEEVQRFAYIVSHDLRSPLVNIMGFTAEIETLRTEIFDELAALRNKLGVPNVRVAELGRDFDEAVAFIKASITKMDRLISAVLKLSREGRREFRPEPIDANELVNGIVATLSHQAGEAGATFSIGALPEVVSDRLSIEQIFSNLLDNALKYLRSDEPGRIEITGQSTPTLAIFEVRDNGRGVDPRDHERIFELFRRSGPQDRPGEGIGLAHVRALVRRLGGTMTLKSELGKGSAFTVTLPRRWSVERDRRAA